MAGKPKSYWRDKFTNYIQEVWPTEEARREPIKSDWPSDFYYVFAARNLLREYSASTRKNYCFSPLRYESGGNCFARFFAGRWGTHHGNAVHAALVELDPPGQSKVQIGNFSIDRLFSVLSDKLQGERLDPNGDLSRIISVIEEQTRKKMPQNMEEKGYVLLN